MPHLPLTPFFGALASSSVASTSASAAVSYLSLPASLLGLPAHPPLLHRLVTSHLASLRAGTSATKSRSETAYSGRKMRPQKGTGHARLGDRGSPMLKGGAHAFAKTPKGPEGWARKVNRKERALAVRTVISERYAQGALGCADLLGLSKAELGKTRVLLEKLEKAGWAGEGGAVFVLPSLELEQSAPATKERERRAREAFEKAARNVPFLHTVRGLKELEVYEVLKKDKLVFDLQALEGVVSELKLEDNLVEEEEQGLLLDGHAEEAAPTVQI